jgi:hypothetical protein
MNQQNESGVPGSAFWHDGVKHILVSQKRDFVGSRCLIEAINTKTGYTALLFADEIR